MNWTINPKDFRKKITSAFSLQFILILMFFIQVTRSTANEYWPQEQWTTASPESQGMSSEILSNLLNTLWKKDYQLDSIIIIRNGHLVLESYNHPGKPHFKHQIYSCTKSVSSALIGIAIDKGYIKSIHQTLLDFFPEKIPSIQDSNKLKITLRDILMMATGLKCEDTVAYNFRGLREMWQRDDWVQYMIDLPLIDTPGSRFDYCNGASALLTAIIQKTTGKVASEFAKEHLFSPLGITDIHWRSHNGITIGYSDLTMRPLDLGRLGYLFLKGGKWKDQQILSAEWVSESTQKQINNTETYGYGYQWWIMSPDIYAARGAYGQRIFVMTGQRMVVVITGQLKEARSQLPEEILYTYILPAIKSNNPLPEDPSSLEKMHSLNLFWRNADNQTRDKRKRELFTNISSPKPKN